jgi:hypothetical protein
MSALISNQRRKTIRADILSSQSYLRLAIIHVPLSIRANSTHAQANRATNREDRLGSSVIGIIIGILDIITKWTK